MQNFKAIYKKNKKMLLDNLLLKYTSKIYCKIFFTIFKLKLKFTNAV